MHQFKPGDKVSYLGRPATVAVSVTLQRIVFDGGDFAVVDPSELTPADPGPDEATMLVRELCAAEADAQGHYLADCYRLGGVTSPATNAFTKYIRANPPRDELTVERVREAVSEVYGYPVSRKAERLHAALTEQAK